MNANIQKSRTAKEMEVEVESHGRIITYSSHWFEPLRAFGVIDYRDIAHALSMKCRWGGHTRTFYSVAEHSVHVSRIVAPEHALWGLLHDAGEAYLPDLPRPIKSHPACAKLVAAEERILRRVVNEWGLPWPIPLAVHEADAMLLATEYRDLMPQRGDWEPSARPLSQTIAQMGGTWSPAMAERLWLARFSELRTVAAAQ